jgi:antirestriction protein ArdC
MTFKQVQEYDAHVRKGEKASFVVYSNKIVKTETDKETGENIERGIPFMRGYNVFNVEQIEGLPEKFSWKPEFPAEESKIKRLENVDQFIKNTGAYIRHGGDKAFYAPASDHIQMLLIDAFKDNENYYATLAHETTHNADPRIMPRRMLRGPESRVFRRGCSA